jgi:hypothetical protein
MLIRSGVPPTYSAVPTDGYHAGRLAIEQMYGYMVRNAKKFGILTTVNSWVFLMRANQGQLWMTCPISCLSIEPPFTILQALYYISALAVQHGHLVETDQNGNPVTIELANSKYPQPAPSAIGYLAQSSSQSSAAAEFIYPLPSGGQYQLAPCDFGHEILLEPWKVERYCGQKSFRALLLPENNPVIVKLWDKYKCSNDDRNKEVQIYMRVQNLWGRETPQLICSADIDFCWGIILEDIQVRFIVLF